MTRQEGVDRTDPPSTPAPSPGPRGHDGWAGVWARIRYHKIVQWGLAYLGAALAIAQAQQFVGQALQWPDLVGRIVVVALVAGLPLALTVAWYHGHKGLQQISAGELMIVSVLILIGALFFRIALRAPAMSAGTAAVRAPTQALDEPASRRVDAAAGQASSAEPPQSPPLPNSIAVLPCQNLSPDPNNAYFADGIHIELLSQLQKLKSLNVTARTAVLQYANAARPVAEIARELNVETVMECSVSYADNRVAVRTTLIDPKTGVYLWSDSYKSEFSNVFEIQADITMNIANALKAEFSHEEQARIERVPTKSSEAYRLYLQAIAIGPLAPDTMVALFERAIAIDPEYAAPYATLARFYSQNLVNTAAREATSAERRPELEATVRRYASRALDLDPQQAPALTALANLQLLTWRWTEAEAAYKRAVEAAPPDSLTASYYGFLLSSLGRHDEAVALGERVVKLDPDAATTGGLGFALGMAGRYDEAAALFRKSVERTPVSLTRHWLGLMEIARGNNDAAQRELETIDRTLDQNRNMRFLPELAYGFARIGRAADAHRLFDEIDAAVTKPVGAGTRAMAHLAIGDHEQALKWLAVAADAAKNHEPDPGFIQLVNLKTNVTNDPVLRRPEFVAALERIRGD
jgi:TolB-like protein/Flp pilus assembly protein TadD